MKRREIVADYNELRNNYEGIEPTRLNVILFPPEKGGGGAIEFNHVFTPLSGRRQYGRLAWFPLTSLWVDEYAKAPFICKAVGKVIQEPQLEETKAALHIAKCVSLFGQIEYNMDRQRMCIISDINATSITVTAASDSYKTYPEGRTYSRTVPIFDNAAAAMKALLTIVEEGTGNTVAGKELVDFSAVSEEILKEVGFVEVKDRMGKAPSMWAGSPNKLILDSDDDYYESQRRSGYKSYVRRAEQSKKMSQLVMDKLTLRLS